MAYNSIINMRKYCYKVFIFVLTCCFISCNNDDNEDFYPENQVIYKDKTYTIENIEFVDSWTIVRDNNIYTDSELYPQRLKLILSSKIDTLQIDFEAFMNYPSYDIYYLGTPVPNINFDQFLYGMVSKNSSIENGELKVIKTEPFFEIKFKGEIKRRTREGIKNEGEIRGHYKGSIDFPEEWMED